MPDRLTKASINLAHYKHNIRSIRQNLKDEVQIMVVVKANAYGHGLEHMAAAAAEEGVSYLGTASLGELKRIRQAGVTVPVLLLGYLDNESIAEAIEYGASITVMDAVSIASLQYAAQAANRMVRVHLKIDTGMHRAGCDPEEVLELASQVYNATNLELEGVYTHLAESEVADSEFTDLQLGVFRTCLDALRSEGVNPPLIHCANSAATIALPEAHFTMVRPGLITYGLNPFDADHSKFQYVTDNFKPVLSLKTRIVHVRNIDEGETVGYNRRWEADRKTTLALLPVGYGDGWRRGPHSAQHVLIRGKRAPVVGSVSMDQTVIDVTDIPDSQVGDEVVLIGIQDENTISANEVAADYGTINYEVVASLSDRITRHYNH